MWQHFSPQSCLVSSGSPCLLWPWLKSEMEQCSLLIPSPRTLQDKYLIHTILEELGNKHITLGIFLLEEAMLPSLRCPWSPMKGDWSPDPGASLSMGTAPEPTLCDLHSWSGSVYRPRHPALPLRSSPLWCLHKLWVLPWMASNGHISPEGTIAQPFQTNRLGRK